MFACQEGAAHSSNAEFVLVNNSLNPEVETPLAQNPDPLFIPFSDKDNGTDPNVDLILRRLPELYACLF